MQEYEDLKTLVTEIEADVDKFDGGNKAAGTRIRKQMQMIKEAAQTSLGAVANSSGLVYTGCAATARRSLTSS